MSRGHRSLVLAVGGALVLVPLAAAAGERANADLQCQPAEDALVYDCTISLTGRKSGQPIERAEVVVKPDMPSMPMAHNVEAVEATAMGGPGRYHARLELEMYGAWALTIDVSGPLRDRIIKTLEFGPIKRGSHGEHASHGAMGHERTMMSGAPCHVPIEISEESERQVGGALYAGSPVEHHASHEHSMPEMEGAHMVHVPQHGGAFFMAPNKMHHLEGVFSDDCGFTLFLYNAFTKHIHVDRFKALIKVVPSREDEPEVMRFLSPSEDNTVLRATVGDAVTRPFIVELYIAFPESDDPELFTIRVPESKSKM